MNIFEYYGIKEVANVYFEALTPAKDGSGIEKGDIVLYLDTLKVSTIETTAENVSAQGGWGNPKLITWDYGKDINVTLEDAVVSFEELRILLGAKLKEATAKNKVTVHMSSDFVAKNVTKTTKDEDDNEVTTTELVLVNTKLDDNSEPIEPALKVGSKLRFVDRANGIRGQVDITADNKTVNSILAYELVPAVPAQGEGTTGTPAVTLENKLKEGSHVMLFWDEDRDGTAADKEAVELTITPNDFPGTFKVVGDALIRNKDGQDEAFQFVINKAKMLSEVTLTMQAEGDPSTFNMTLNVLRDDDGNMMSLIKY